MFSHQKGSARVPRSAPGHCQGWLWTTLRGALRSKQQDFVESCLGSSVLFALGEAELSWLDSAGQGSWRNGQCQPVGSQRGEHIPGTHSGAPLLAQTVLRVQMHPRTTLWHCCANLQWEKLLKYLFFWLVPCPSFPSMAGSMKSRILNPNSQGVALRVLNPIPGSSQTFSYVNSLWFHLVLTRSSAKPLFSWFHPHLRLLWDLNPTESPSGAGLWVGWIQQVLARSMLFWPRVMSGFPELIQDLSPPLPADIHGTEVCGAEQAQA